MGRKKVHKVRYRLDAQDVAELSAEEIAAVLRGADDLIMTGGRSMLTKILKGSRDKKLLGLGLDGSPVYGYYKHLTLAKIQARVDWVILNGYLAIEYEWSIPLLRYTKKGWEIEKQTIAEELLAGFDALLASGEAEFDMLHLKDRPRDLILLLLDLVEGSGDARYVPLLAAWAEVDYKKVRQRIGRVIKQLEEEADAPRI